MKFSQKIDNHSFIYKFITSFFITFLCLNINVALADCDFASASSLDFGTYSVLDFMNSNGVGAVTVNCTGNGQSSVVALSTGVSNSYASRYMLSGADKIRYNIYVDAARTLVWGDGSAGNYTNLSAPHAQSTYYLFGQIPARQNVSAGVYVDNIVITVNF